MKRLIALAAVIFASQGVAAFAGEPMVSSKAVVPPPAPPPPEYFRPNEFDIGAFATYATGTEGNLTGWGGGMDFSYFFPWKYAGVRFQGAGVDFTSDNVTVVGPNGRTRSGNIDRAAGILSSQIILRLPLDSFWTNVHLAPYIFGGFGGIFVGSGDNNVNFATNLPGAGRRVARRNTLTNQGYSRVLGNVGGGFEYRFTPHIGLFGEAGYNIPEGSRNNFVQTNFGLRYAF
jgi:hypothetical protein